MSKTTQVSLCLFVLFIVSFAGRPANADILKANVKDFGAKGDGITADQGAFRNALAWLVRKGGGQLYIPAGTYILAKETRRASGTIEIQDASNLEIYGDGVDKSVLKLQPGIQYGFADTHVIRVRNSAGLVFHDLTIDGSRTTFTTRNEQMHGLYLFNTNNVTIKNVRFLQMRGDGVYLIGENGTTANVVIQNCQFYDNGRSGIANQGGVGQLSFLTNTFELTYGQDIDMEPTGNRPGPINVVIKGNLLNHTSPTAALTITGTRNDLTAKHVTVSDNTITGQVIVIRAEDVTISNNIIRAALERRALEISRFAQQIEIKNNTITGEASEVIHLTGTSVSEVHLDGNQIQQITQGNKGIFVEGAGNNITFTDNTIVGVPVMGSGVGIAVRNQANDGVTRSGIALTDNRINGFPRGIAFSTNNAATGFADVTITGNTIDTGLPGATPTTAIQFSTNTGPTSGDVFIQGLTVEGNVVLP